MMPSGSGDGTESFTWDTETEWNNGTFTDHTTTDGAGNLVLADPADTGDPVASTQNEDFTVDGDTNDNPASNSYLIEDADTGTTLASGNGVQSPITETIDIHAHPVLYFEVTATSDGDFTTADISITDFEGTTVASLSLGNNAGTQTDSDTVSYESYLPAVHESGEWVSDQYTFTETTTATRIEVDSTFNDPTDSIGVTVRVPGGGDSASTTISSSGVQEAYLEVAASTSYEVVVSPSAGDPDTGGPSVASVTMETHSPTDGLTVSDTRDAEQDLSWNPLSVCDGYEVYQSETTPVTTSDTLAYSNTDNTNTSTTIMSLENGEDYYYNVRPVYSGE